jgi:hypothetical protein
MRKENMKGQAWTVNEHEKVVTSLLKIKIYPNGKATVLTA